MSFIDLCLKIDSRISFFHKVDDLMMNFSRNLYISRIERFSEQEDKYREKIRDLEASNLDLKSEARRIHALEDQV